MTRVLALDLSVTATGVALPDGTTQTLATRPGDGDLRYDAIADYISHAAQFRRADIAVIEGPVVRSSAAIAIGMLHGVVRRELRKIGVPYVLVPPATLKAYATGKGNADKTQMAIAALKRTGREFADDNQCDAWWLRAAALDWYGRAEFDMPKAQRDRLAKVKWPEVAR